MTDTIHTAFATAERLAPVPATQDAPVDDWTRHYAATALAAWTVFDREVRFFVGHPTQGSRPEIGYLAALGNCATAAAVALTESGTEVARTLWWLTPEMGALNGEWEEWITDTLDRLGVNPADINPEYIADDFRSPSAAGAVVTR